MKRAILVFFIGSCAFLGGGTAVTFLPRLQPPVVAQSASSGPEAPISDVLKLSERFEFVARRVSPAVVYVEATKPARPAAGKVNPLEESGSGVDRKSTRLNSSH